MQKHFIKPPFIFSIVLGFILLIPFMILEVVNRLKFNERFPFALFTFAWLLQSIFILILMPLLKKIQAGKSPIKNPLSFLLPIIGLAIIVYIWGGWVVDQWPCLMGVPNCD